MEWQPIETAPEDEWILTYADWDLEPHITVSRFKNITSFKEVLEHESINAKGRRKIIQEVAEQVREWHGHWEPTHWMPLPSLPHDAT